MVLGQVVPEGLAAMPPGPDLVRILDGIDPTAVCNDDILDVLQAQSKQLAHDQAQMFTALNEVIHRLPFAGPAEIRRAAHPEPYGADEVRAALAWTRRAADAETDLAHTLVDLLPRVHAALLAGAIDRPKATVFARHLSDLTPAQIVAVCDAVLPVAPRLTTGQITDRIKRLICELDPAYYQRRYRKAVRDRRVIAYLAEDGTAVIAASGLPADEAAAAWERLDALARTAQHDGHPGTLDQIRADLTLGLYDGTLHGLDRTAILHALLERFAGHTDTDLDKNTDAASDTVARTQADEQHTGRRHHDDAATADNRTDTRRTSNSSTDSGQGQPDGAADLARTAHGGIRRDHQNGAVTGSERAGVAPRRTDFPAPQAAQAEPADIDLTESTHAAQARQTAEPDHGHRVGTEIRVPLSTLLHIDQRPGELPGWGPVPADAARRTVARQRRAQWRWVVADDGHLIADGITRRRPTHLPRRGPRGGVVEIQVPATLLDDLAAAADDHGPWAGVITDIAARFTAARDRDSAMADLDAHPHDRFPRAGLRRHTQVRDRTCVHPGCRAPARRADQDHTLDHARGGPTTQDDLAPICRHDHMLKTEGGWTLDQPEPGRFLWRSPLGRTYPVQPEPILPPPPTPVTRDDDPWFDEPARETDQQMSLRPRDRAPPEPPSDRDAVVDPEDTVPPPF